MMAELAQELVRTRRIRLFLRDTQSLLPLGHGTELDNFTLRLLS